MAHSANSFIRFSFILVLSLLLLGAAPEAQCESAKSKTPESVAILPLTIHASKDLSYLKDGIGNMMASRLAANAGVTIVDKQLIDKTMADLNITDTGTTPAAVLRKAGSRLGADYLIIGSLTALGSSMSLDARVLKTAGDAEPRNFYATAAGEDEVLLAVNQMVWDITEKVFGKGKSATATSRPAPETQAAPGLSSYQTPHPDRAFMYPAAGRTGKSPFVRPTGMGSTAGFTKSQNFSINLQGMDAGDVDGDGTAEVILAGRSEVRIYKRSGNRFQLIGKVPIKNKGYSIHYVSVADLNNNGRAEIYVSAADRKTPSSFALEWHQGKFEYLFEKAPWYIRALRQADGRMILAGQQADIDSPLKPGIFELQPGARLQLVQKLQVPAGVNLFDFSMVDLDNDGRVEIVSLDQNDRLRVMRPSGDVLWQGDERYGGTTRFIGEARFIDKDPKLTDITDTEGRMTLDRIYIPGRIIVTDVNNDGLADIILNKNLSTASRFTRNLKSYPSGEIHCLTWNGISLSELWHTRKISGYIADYQLLYDDRDNPESAELLVGLGLRTTASMLGSSSGKSTVLTYQLDFSGEED